jgi:excisionase family DNA binding protein
MSAIDMTDLVAHPERAPAVSLEDARRLYPVAARLEAELRALLLAGAAALQGGAPARPVPAGSELTVEQVARRIGRPLAYVRELLRRKDLPGFRRGKYWVIPESALATWQGGGLDCAGTPPPPSGRP